MILLHEKQPIVLDVYEVLDQLGISRDAIRFLIDQPGESGEEASLEHVLPG